MKLLLLSFGVLSAHLALIGWFEVSLPPRQPEIALVLVQTRQILTPPSFHEPVTPVVRHHPEPSLPRTKPVTTKNLATPDSPPPMASGKQPTQTTTSLTVSAGTESEAPANSDKSVHTAASPSDMASNNTADATKGVQLPSSNAAYLNNPTPPYPILSLRLREKGKVVVRVLIGKNGQALDGHVVQSSNFDRLDQAALKAALAWRYVPGKVDGQARDMWYDVPLNFNPPN